MEDTVKVDFEQFVAIIDSLLQLCRNFKSLRKFRNIRVDENRVSVSIDDLRAS